MDKVELVTDATLCSSLISALGASYSTVNILPTLIAAIKSSSGNNSDDKLLCFNGVINTGDLNLILDDTIYQGQGTIRVGTANSEADIDILGNVTPLNKDFPTGSVLGLVSNHDINITPANPNTKQAFIAFAEDTINISKQTVIAGSLIASRFKTTEIPQIAYVPDTKEAAESLVGLPQLIGLGTVTELSMTAYERR